MNFLSPPGFRKLAAALALTLTATVPAMRAQFTPDIALVNVPFAFEVGSAHFAAGQYMLSILRQGLLQIHGGSNSALTMSHNETANSPSKKSVVLFHKYGDKYFLAEIRTKGSGNYIECAGSGAEDKARKTNLALNRSQAAGVEIAVVEAIR